MLITQKPYHQKPTNVSKNSLFAKNYSNMHDTKKKSIFFKLFF